MGFCDFCSEKAGWFQDRHPACNARAEELKKSLYDLILNGALSGKIYAELETEAKQLTSENKVPFFYFCETLLQGANDAASQIALRSAIPEDELNRLVCILQGFGINARDLAQRRLFGLPLLSMSHTLWQILNDIAPYYDATDRMQFNLQPEEIPVFSVGKVTFAEERTVSTAANSGSLSIPLGAGVSYNFDIPQANGDLQKSGLLPLDVGELLITDLALYFGGAKKTLRIQLNHVIRYQPYVDGVGVCISDEVPKVFVPDYSGMDTGWFFFKLLSTLTSRSVNNNHSGIARDDYSFNIEITLSQADF
jgi:hypothetical protein